MSSVVNRRRFFAALIVLGFLLAVFGVNFTAEPQFGRAQASARIFSLDRKYATPDAVTDAIRRESNVLARVYVKNEAERQAAGNLGKVVQDYGSFVIISKDRTAAAKAFGLEEETVDTTVNLPGARFEPLEQMPPGSLRMGANAVVPGDGYYVLQFGATATDEWLKSLSDAGVEVLQYVANQAYLVYGSSESIARVAGHSRVRWIGAYTTEQKLSENLRTQIDAAAKGRQPRRGLSPIEFTKARTSLFDVGVFSRADLDAVASQLRSTFGRGYFRVTELQHTFFHVIRVELAIDDVEKVAALPDVAGITIVTKTRNEDARSAKIISGNYLNLTTLASGQYDPIQQFGVDGTHVTVSVVDDGVGIPGDGGFYIHGLNAVNGPLRGTQLGAFGHGHLNATIIGGAFQPVAPNDHNLGLGVAPGVNIVNIPRNRIGYTGTDAQVYDDSVSTPGLTGVHATISNNSWGEDVNGNQYQFIKEGMFDGFVRDASIVAGIDPITLIFSAGNSGNFGLTRPKVAKNVISVGNSESLRPELAGANSNNIDDIAPDSSRGPTADGRIKPDIVSPGVAVTGGRSGTNSLSGNLDDYHRWSSGTSQAAANATGAAALISQWVKNRFVLPTPSLIKAALINSAVDLNGQGSEAPIPNGSEGWGRPNLKTLLSNQVSVRYISEELNLENTADAVELNGSVADATKPVRITLAWTDPPGMADPALVNNLDLIVTVGGVTYKGNVISNGVSVPGGAADTKNNVESVFLPAGIPTGTQYLIQVRATALNGDGILINPDATDQNYSLVAYNWSGLPGNQLHQMAGRVISATGRGVGMAKVRITDNNGDTREIRTNPLGYFFFPNVVGGRLYTINVTAKRYTFPQQQVTVNGNMTGLTVQAGQGAP